MALDKVKYRIIRKREDKYVIEYKYPYIGEWTEYKYIFDSIDDAKAAIAEWQRLESTSRIGEIVWESE